MLVSPLREIGLGGSLINCREKSFSSASPLLLTLVLSKELLLRWSLKLSCFGYSLIGFYSSMSASDVLSSSD
jgi:hypothetical protein